MKIQKYPIDGRFLYVDADGNSLYRVLENDTILAGIIIAEKKCTIILRTEAEIKMCMEGNKNITNNCIKYAKSIKGYSISYQYITILTKVHKLGVPKWY